jgi:enamine deaminase RidA (YjgF/YER057c/UK114 family)
MTTKKVSRTNFTSASPWEPLRGFSRAVRVGDTLYVSGTTAMVAGNNVLSPNDPYEQTKAVIGVIKDILLSAGFALSDVVRTRLFVTNMADFDKYAQAHREVFQDVRPASSLVQVSKLVDPRLVVEMEVEAVLGCDEHPAVEKIKTKS